LNSAEQERAVWKAAQKSWVKIERIIPRSDASTISKKSFFLPEFLFACCCSPDSGVVFAVGTEIPENFPLTDREGDVVHREEGNDNCRDTDFVALKPREDGNECG
jgi:hypothetical protein